MTDAHGADADDRSGGRLSRRLRRESILAGVLVAVGIAVLPLAIFHIGQRLLGEYSTEGAGVLHLYGTVLRDMGAGNLFAWLLVLSPWLGILLLRALWWPLRSRQSPTDTSGEV